MEFKPLVPGPSGPTLLKLVPWHEIDPAVALDYHMHTTHTDGKGSVGEMADAALEAGIGEILFSEHVRHSSTYFPDFAREVRELNRPGLCAYVGAEAKVIDFTGTLDCSQQVVDECDALIGSVHSPPAEDGATRRWEDIEPKEALDLEFRLALAIITQSRAHIIGHPLGMVIRKFKLSPLDQLRELAEACRESDKAFELNARYCPHPDDWIDIAKDAGCKVSLGSDAHMPRSVGNSWHRFVLAAEVG
jgi:putative hydrolase